MSDLVHMARQLEQIAEKKVVVDTELQMLQEEREEVESFLTGRIAVLTELLEQKDTHLRDEYSQHMRYNKYKLIVETDLGEDKKETTKDWKKKAHNAAKPLFISFVENQQKEAKERAEEDAVEKAAHKARMKKIREDGAKSIARVAPSGDKAKSARKKAEPKEKKDAKPRPKTAQQLFCWEEATQVAYRKAKEENTDKTKPFPAPVTWGNARFAELPESKQEEYKTQAKKLRQEAGLPPVVPRATPRTKPKEANGAKQATLQGIVKKKKKEAKGDKAAKGKAAATNDSDDEEEEVEEDGNDSDDASDSKRKRAGGLGAALLGATAASDDEEEEKEEDEEDEEEHEEDDNEDAPPAKKPKGGDDDDDDDDGEGDEASPARAAAGGAESSDDE